MGLCLWLLLEKEILESLPVPHLFINLFLKRLIYLLLRIKYFILKKWDYLEQALFIWLCIEINTFFSYYLSVLMRTRVRKDLNRIILARGNWPDISWYWLSYIYNTLVGKKDNLMLLTLEVTQGNQTWFLKPGSYQ